MYRTRCQPTRSCALSSFVVLAQKFPNTFRFTYAQTFSMGFNSGEYGGR